MSEFEAYPVASFQYQAVTSDGSTKSGQIEAADRRAALRVLTDRGLFPSKLVPSTRGGRAFAGTAAAERIAGDATPASPVTTAPAATPATSAPAAPAARPATSPDALGEPVAIGRISRREITAFTRELATLFEATIPIPKALATLGEQEENESLKRVVDDIASRVRRGQSFSGALEQYPKHFPKLYTSMIEVGEESGRLAEVMADLATLREDEDEMRSEVASAIAYPAFVLFLGLVTAFILLAFVMPGLFKMLSGLGNVLPAPTRILLAVSAFFQNYWWLVLVGVVGGAFGLRAWLKSSDGRATWDRWKLKLPVLGGLFRALALGRFARTLGTLEASGVSLLPALEIVKNTVGNVYVSQRIEEVAEGTRGGDSLAAPIRRLDLFPPTMVQMIAVGEETGRLGTMLLQVAAIQERLMRSRARTLISLLAPVLILFVGAMVGFIVISLLLPIFRMSQGLQ